MAFFGVTIEEIDKSWRHSNADALDLAKLKGISFQFVVGRDSVQPGDMVIYFPIDSVLPEAVKAVLPEVITKKLSGRDKNRVKTNKLRQEISQGIPVKITDFPLEKFGIVAGEWLPQKTVIEDTVTVEETVSYNGMLLPKDLTRYLGVEKYEPPVVDMGNCALHRLPEVSPYYDIEGADRNQHIIDHLIDLDVDVAITEKLEGTNHSTVVEVPEHNLRICQRSGEVVLLEEKAVSIYHEGAKFSGLPEKAKEIANLFGQTVTLRGEMLGPGIQGNFYRLKKLEVVSFELALNGKPMDWIDEKELMDKFKIKRVPLLFVGKLKDFLAGRTIQQASNGISTLHPDLLREGIVIRPVRELPAYERYGRVIIKQRSPEYLAKYGR